MQAIEKENDDLTKIPGIGPARQLWLGEVFGVRTYEDLTRLSADEIEVQLKADNKPCSRNDIEHWLQEAAKLAARKKKFVKGNSGQAEPKPANQQTEPEKNTSNPGAGDGHWQQVAFFNISYLVRRVDDQVMERRTHINYHETDDEEYWDGFEIEQISQWILEHGRDKLSQGIQETPAAEPESEVVKEEALPARIEITVRSLRLFQPAGAEISLGPGDHGRPYTGTIQADQPFAVEAEFGIGEQAAALIGKLEIPYQVQFFIQNRSTKDKKHLGDAESGVIVGDKANYSAALSEIKLSPGTYRLRVVVLAESRNVTLGYFELPRLRVVGE